MTSKSSDIKKISVCVPAYERPSMMKQLIYSFLAQDYNNKELVIADDSKSDLIRDLINTDFKDIKEISYYKNSSNLGYCKNFLNSIRLAKGDYLLILGDDDAFISKQALSEYVAIFNKYESVDYIYSNQIQFNNKLEIEYIFNFFQEDKLFKKGVQSMNESWLTSIFIPGMGLRNNRDFTKIYPITNILFPQLYMVGSIINETDSFGLSNALIAGRAHEDQLGFMAIKGKNIKDEEQHGTVEIFTILDELIEKYQLDYPRITIEKKLVDAYSTMLLKEKIVTDNQAITYNYNNFIRVSEYARQSKKLRVFYIIALILPKFLIRIIRYFYIKFNQMRDNNEFNQMRDKLSVMTNK